MRVRIKTVANMGVVAIVIALIAFAGSLLAEADVESPRPPRSPVKTSRDTLILDAAKRNAAPRERSNARRTSHPDKPKYTYVPKNEYDKRTKAWRAEYAAAMKYNNKLANARMQCIESPTRYACNGGTYRALPRQLNLRPAGNPTPPPALSPQEAAYYAVARLRLTPPTPMIGPPPAINQWKMAAVGYPMWLWAEGNLTPAPVTDTVADLTVALHARLAKVVYDLGDGHKLTCTTVSQPWTTRVTPGTPSPSCGYTYRKPSLPKGNYTITAHTVWAVDWAVNGTTGTIPFDQSATTHLPVGELQVLIR